MSKIAARIKALAEHAREFILALPVAARSMRRNPGFFVIAVSSLAIALGLSTAVFAHIDALTHPYTPLRDVDRLYRVWIPGQGAVNQPTGDEIAELMSKIPSFDGIAAGRQSGGTVAVGEKGGEVTSESVPPEYFATLGLAPRLGRLFSETETEESGVAIISDVLWKLLFNDRAQIGEAKIEYDGKSYAVVGVLPRGFGQEVLLPRAAHLSRYTFFTVRLKRGATEAQAKSDLKVLTDRLTSVYGTGRNRFSFHFGSAKPDPLQLKAYHGAMIGAAVCILMIACANVAALMLARGVVKRRDQALRLSLGATRANLLTTVAAEVTILAVAGGVAGVVLATWAMHLIAGVVPETAAEIGVAVAAQWNGRVFMEAFAMMIVAVALAAALPAWNASRISPNEPLKESAGTTTGRSGSKFRLLVVAEVAMSMVLLMGSSLIAKATRNVAHFDFGYDARPLFMVSASVGIRADSAARTVDSLNAAGKRPQVTASQFEAALNGVRGLRNVLSASAFSYGIAEKFTVISDQSRGAANKLSMQRYMNVGSDFMKTVGIRIIEGRDFSEGDRAGKGAVILDELAAKKLFPHGGAIGHLVKLGDEASKLPWLEVVGISHSAILKFPVDSYVDEEAIVFASLPLDARSTPVIMVRPRGSPTGPMLAAQRLFKSQFPPRSYVQTRLWLDNYESLLGLREFTASMFVGLGVASLALAAAGLFSVLSYSVGQRMREFAVRVALGADRTSVMRLVLSDGLVMALGGTGIGAILGMWAGSLLESFLWGVHPADATALVLAEAVLIGVTMGSCIVPAIRATRADPLEILRAT